MNYSKRNKGTISELICTQELVREGYDVFWAVQQDGPVDIVAVHPDTGNIRLIDVKTASRRRKDNSRIYRTPTPRQKAIGVEIIEVDLDEHFDV